MSAIGGGIGCLVQTFCG